MDSLFSVVAAIEAVGLLGAFVALAVLYRRVRELDARASATDAQMVAIAREAQQMGAAVALRLAEQRQESLAAAAKPRRGRGKPRADTVPAPPSIVTAPRGQEPVAVLPVKAAPAPAVDEPALSDHDLARERGMDPLGLAIQRKLVGQAIRTA